MVVESYLELIEKAKAENLIKEVELKDLPEDIFLKIDFCYFFTEIPNLFVSKKKNYPHLLIFQGKIWKVFKPKRVIKLLGMKEV